MPRLWAEVQGGGAPRPHAHLWRWSFKGVGQWLFILKSQDQEGMTAGQIGAGVQGLEQVWMQLHRLV